ncbi:MAG: fluoride exporter [Clostridiales bacterium]|nr:fluoride exporter [Clostridiales bacterium]MDN5299530.1 fluoride exporter [Clostridiales bacterium]
MSLIWVAVGGAFGSISRFQMGKMIAEKTTDRFPFGTFCVNILGAFLLGIVSNADFGGTAYALLGDGFLGAFTTFSTFMFDGFNLFEDNELLNAVAYILLTVILGVISYHLGYWIMTH